MNLKANDWNEKLHEKNQRLKVHGTFSWCFRLIVVFYIMNNLSCYSGFYQLHDS